MFYGPAHKGFINLKQHDDDEQILTLTWREDGGGGGGEYSRDTPRW